MGGLDKLVDSEIPGVQEYKQYGHHEWNDKLQSMVDELQERFPIEIQVGFIEVSPQMTRCEGNATNREEGYYIRVAEFCVEQASEEYVKTVVAHEMAHIYLWQLGHDDLTEKSAVMSWVLGQVGGTVSGYHEEARVWQDVCKPFLKE